MHPFHPSKLQVWMGAIDISICYTHMSKEFSIFIWPIFTEVRILFIAEEMANFLTVYAMI
jgi:hypothetical protein